MNRNHVMLWLAAVLLVAAPMRAQEKEKPAAEKPAPAEKAAVPQKPPVPLMVTLVFSEYEGERKISSLPYTMPVNAQVAPRPTGSFNQLRMGVRVPIVTGSGQEGRPSQFQYMDVGTNIDCRAWSADGTQFEIELQAERSSIYASKAGEGKRVEWSPGEELYLGSQPIVRQYRSTMTLLMRDGQTVQRSMATDPVSGRVLKVDVTLNVVK